MTGWIPLVATRIQDALGNLLASGTLEVLPTDANDKYLASSAGGIGGPLTNAPIRVPVLNGALVNPAMVPDTSQTSPANICLRITVRDQNGITIYKVTQVQTGGLPQLNLDTYAGGTLLPNPLFLRGPVGPMGSPGSFGPNVKFASQLGCLTDGSDCAPILNSFLASASVSSPKFLILDGIYSISGLTLSPNGHTTIGGLSKFDTGFHLLPNSYRDGIKNGAYSLADPTNQGVPGSSASTANCTSIVLQNFIIDCTANPVLTPANQPISGAPAHAIFAVNLQSAQDCLIENVVFTHPPAYCIMLSNCSRIKVRGCSFASDGYTQDGVHMNGPASYIEIDNCDFATGDDAVALNAPEGMGGIIDTVRVTNCRFQNSYAAARIYTSNSPNAAYKVRQVLFANLIGVVQTVPFNIGLEPYLGSQDLTPLEQVEDVRIANCDVFPVMASDQSTKKATLANIMTNVGSLIVSGYTQRASGSGGGFNLDPPFLIRAGAQIADLAIRDFVLYQDAHGNGTPSCVVNNLGTIGKLTIDGVRVVSGDGAAYTPLNCLIGNAGPIGTLMLNSVDSTNIGLTISNGDFSQVSAVGGAALAALPNEVPDAVMLPGWLYRSSNTHTLSMKVGSTPLRLTTTT